VDVDAVVANVEYIDQQLRISGNGGEGDAYGTLNGFYYLQGVRDIYTGTSGPLGYEDLHADWVEITDDLGMAADALVAYLSGNSSNSLMTSAIRVYQGAGADARTFQRRLGREG